VFSNSSTINDNMYHDSVPFFGNIDIKCGICGRKINATDAFVKVGLINRKYYHYKCAENMKYNIY